MAENSLDELQLFITKGWLHNHARINPPNDTAQLRNYAIVKFTLRAGENKPHEAVLDEIRDGGPLRLERLQHVLHIDKMIVKDDLRCIEKTENCGISAAVINITALLSSDHNVLGL